MITAATAGNPSGRYHGAQNKILARKVLRESATQPVKDYHGHPPETSSKKWPRIPPVPNIVNQTSHITDLNDDDFFINDMIESLNASFHDIMVDLNQCFRDFDMKLMESMSMDNGRDVKASVNSKIHSKDGIVSDTGSNANHKVISEFIPYRDGYDPKLMHNIPGLLATLRIMSLFEPHRDSYDLANGSNSNHCLPSRFRIEFVPHRDSYDQKQRKMDTFGWNCFATSSYSPYFSYEYSYDGGSRDEFRTVSSFTRSITA